MATRRPRVKALANLGTKRSKTSAQEKADPPPNYTETYVKREVEQLISEQKTEELPIEEKCVFKHPQILDIPKKACSPEDVQDDIFQTDFQESSTLNTSPAKSRQRIKPTPVFGIRRNSVQSPSLDSGSALGQKREKSNCPYVQNALPNVKTRPFARTRTESSCSTSSDSISRDNSKRKIGTEEHQKLSAAKKEFFFKYNGKLPEKSLLKMFDFIYYNPTTNPMDAVCPDPEYMLENNEKVEEIPKNDEIIPKKDVSPPEPEVTTNAPVPQLKLGPNGEIILDEKSLEVETTAEKEARKTLANASLIYLDEHSGNNGFYRRQKRTRDWPPEETIKFYKCLHTVGTDFSLMLPLFPKRSRRDLKLKFKKEEKCNAGLINKAILYPKDFNIDELKLELQREEDEANQKKMLWKKIQNQTVCGVDIQDHPYISKTHQILKKAVVVYKNENVPVENLSSHAVKRRGRKRAAENSQKIKKHPKNKDVVEGNECVEEEVLLITENSGIQKNSEIDIKPTIKNRTKKQLQNSLEISDIIKKLANGSLAFVSSLDQSDPNHIHKEIYVINEETGELSDKSLDLPQEIIDIISEVYS